MALSDFKIKNTPITKYFYNYADCTSTIYTGYSDITDTLSFTAYDNSDSWTEPNEIAEEQGVTNYYQSSAVSSIYNIEVGTKPQFYTSGHGSLTGGTTDSYYIIRYNDSDDKLHIYEADSSFTEGTSKFEYQLTDPKDSSSVKKIQRIIIDLQGAGGGGGSTKSSTTLVNTGAGGGGSGAHVTAIISTNYTWYVKLGAAGTAGSDGGNGGDGGNAWISTDKDFNESTRQSTGAYIMCGGGGGGTGVINASPTVATGGAIGSIYLGYVTSTYGVYKVDDKWQGCRGGNGVKGENGKPGSYRETVQYAYATNTDDKTGINRKTFESKVGGAGGTLSGEGGGGGGAASLIGAGGKGGNGKSVGQAGDTGAGGGGAGGVPAVGGTRAGGRGGWSSIDIYCGSNVS